MEIFAALIPLIAFIIPMIVMFIIYAAVIALIIWFIISFLNNQKERNRLLAEISDRLKNGDETAVHSNQDMEASQTEDKSI